MELKVWVDGMQRVVCGVTSSTTCQDVVFALAHATGQTGRFTLIEKWRNNERLLSPNERPVQVLSKWGEYANDVHFLMRRSSEGAPAANLPNQQLQAPRILSPNCSLSGKHGHIRSPTAAKVSPMTEELVKKSLTFSGSHNSFEYKDHHANQVNSTHQMNNNQKDMNSNTSQSSADPMVKRKLPPPYDEALAKSCYHPFHSSSSPPTTSTATTTPTSASSLIKAKTSQSDLQQTISSNSPKAQTQSNNKRRLPGSGSSSSSPQSNTPQKQKITLTTEMLTKGTAAKSSPQGLHKDAVKLIALQQETMVSQKEELIELDQEIEDCDGSHAKEVAIREEMVRMEKVWIDNDKQLSQIEKQLLKEEMEVLKEEQEQMEVDTERMKEKVNQVDHQIAVCRQKIQLLMDQIKEQQHVSQQQEVKRRENEEKEKRQLVEEINDKTRLKERQLDEQEKAAEASEEELHDLGQNLKEKELQLSLLLKQLKEENITGLTLSAADEVSRSGQTHVSHGDGTAGQGQGFQQRLGSTRRMIGSPRELENAVATNKNPHGVWV